MRAGLVAGIALLAATASADPLTVREAVDEALARNPRIVASGASISAARARSRQARSAWLPRVEASAASTQSNNPVFVFGSLLEQGRFAPEHFDPVFLNAPPSLRNDRLSLTVRYPLFDQLRRLGSTQQAHKASEQSQLADEELRQRIRLEVLQSYSAVLLAGERREVAASAVRAAEAEAQAIRDRLRQGLLVESDLLSAEVQLARYRQQQVDAEGELAIARAALATILQRPVESPVEVTVSLQTPPSIVPSLQTAIERGTTGRAAIKAARLAAENAHIELRTARGSLLPRLDGYASWGASGSTFRDQNADRTFGFIATIDLFDAAKLARVAEARAEEAAAVAARDAAADAVTMEIVTAFHRLRAAEQRTALAARSAEQANAAARIVRDRYANGLTTITEQLRADTTVVAAQLDLLAARYDRIIGAAELLRAMGELHDVDSFQ